MMHFAKLHIDFRGTGLKAQIFCFRKHVSWVIQAFVPFSSYTCVVSILGCVTYGCRWQTPCPLQRHNSTMERNVSQGEAKKRRSVWQHVAVANTSERMFRACLFSTNVNVSVMVTSDVWTDSRTVGPGCWTDTVRWERASTAAAPGPPSSSRRWWRRSGLLFGQKTRDFLPFGGQRVW